MACKSHILVQLLAFLFFNIIHFTHSTQCIKTEREALLKLKSGLQDPGNRLSSWVGDNRCSWVGVRCSNRTGHVVRLNLRCDRYCPTQLRYCPTQMSGALTPSLLALQHLKHLDLSGNNFTGTSVPEFIGSFKELTYLNLSWGRFEGSVPQQLGNISSLQYLDLSANSYFKTTIPDWLFNITSLKNLQLSSNQFEGSIPSSVGRLTSLNVLDLSYNLDITAPLPKELGHLCNLQSLRLSSMNLSIELNQLHEVFSGCVKHSLEELDFSYSQLSGTLPDWLGEIKNLESLSLFHNSIYGSIPESLGRLSNLVTLILSENSLNGVISQAHFANLTKLKLLDLSSNSFVLDVASDWVPPFKLESLALGSCNIGPQFPRWLQNQHNRSTLDLSNAGISDAMPEWVWSFSSQLDCLVLSNNQISGSISSSLCKLVELNVLQMSNNSLSGELPDCWDKLSGLHVFDFSNNSFSGGIPSSICSHDSLEILHLSKNGLTGELSSNLQNCTRLNTLDLGNNKFTGKIPSWVGENLSRLQILSLRSNKLDGDIPHQLGQLTQLQILDLSHNALSGVIPRSFGNFSAMWGPESTLYSFYAEDHHQFLNWKGKELDFISNFEFLKLVDLSQNNLLGNIPEEIEKLIGLLSLNLSENHLTGRIPDKIGNLSHLESLDLSNNVLSGEIPQSLAMLTFLSRLNLSHNSLSGSIPIGPQLQTLTDPSIYVGNFNLCGFPLPKCGEEPMPPINSIGKEKENEVEDDHTWIYSGIGPGFGVGIWVFSSTILLKKPWREALFHWVDNMCTVLHLVN